METNPFQRQAVVFSDGGNPELAGVINLLEGSGYSVNVPPVEGMSLEIRVFPTSNRFDARRLNPQQLKRFLNGEEIPRTMWTII